MMMNVVPLPNRTRWDQKENVISESSARHKRGIRTQLSNVKERYRRYGRVQCGGHAGGRHGCHTGRRRAGQEAPENVTVVIPGGGGSHKNARGRAEDKRRLRTSRWSYRAEAGSRRRTEAVTRRQDVTVVGHDAERHGGHTGRRRT